MFRRASTLLCLLLSLLVASPAVAQRNPFAEDEEAEEQESEDSEEEAADPDEAAEAAKAAKAAAEEAALRESEATAAREEAARLLEDEAEEEEEVEEDEDEEIARGGRVGLSRNFGRIELITTAAALPLGLTLAIGGPSIFGEPDASMTTPRLGSLDYELSIASHGDLLEGTPFMFGIFDIAGIAYPATLGTFYLISGVYLWAADAPLFGAQSVNIDHSMIAMAQTVGWTALAVGVSHLFIGREKPYAAFQRSAYGEEDEPGANLSFISTTTALSFAMSSFAARDYADFAMRRGQNIVTGAILPFTLAYGLSAMIGYSAIYGQQHYFSDIAVSALIGGLIGNLSYVAHFDSDGRPRTDRTNVASRLSPTLLTHPDERATLGLGLSGRF